MKLHELKHNPDNPRTITDDKLKMLKKSYETHGDLGGVVFNVRSQQLIGGHQTSKVLSQSPIHIDRRFDKPTKTGTVAEGWIEIAGERLKYREVDVDEPTEKAMNIAANKGAGAWAFPQLGQWMEDLKALNWDLDLTMFDAEERAAIAPPVQKIDPQCDEDEVPEAPVEPKTRLGDIYQLGRHRLMCGDSTSIDAVEKLMNGEKAHLIFTDPPYGVKYEQGKFTGNKPKKKFDPIANDDKQGEDLYQFIFDSMTCAAMVSDTACIYAWSPPLWEGAEILRAIMDAGFNVQSQIVWDKKRLILGRADYQWRHEICWYGYKGKNHHWCGDRNQTSVWEQKRDSSYVHPTQKPVELAERGISNSLPKNGNVLDLFGGSGSTLIAAEKVGGKAFLMELSPVYADVIVERWEKYTGQKAKLLTSSGTAGEDNAS